MLEWIGTAGTVVVTAVCGDSKYNADTDAGTNCLFVRVCIWGIRRRIQSDGTMRAEPAPGGLLHTAITFIPKAAHGRIHSSDSAWTD